MAATRTRDTFRTRSSKVAPGLCAVAARDGYSGGRLGGAMRTHAISNVDWAFWFAILSPITGALLGYLTLLLFYR